MSVNYCGFSLLLVLNDDVKYLMSSDAEQLLISCRAIVFREGPAIFKLGLFISY